MPTDRPGPAGPSASSTDAVDSDVLATFDLTRDALPYLLRCAHARAESFFMATMCVDNLTPRQITLLTASHQQPGATVTELSDTSAVDINTTSEVIKRLIAKGFLQRRRSERDRRAYLIDVTPAGHDVLRRILPNNDQLAKLILDPVPESDRPMFIHCLRLVAGLAPPTSTTDRRGQ